MRDRTGKPFQHAEHAGDLPLLRLGCSRGARSTRSVPHARGQHLEGPAQVVVLHDLREPRLGVGAMLGVLEALLKRVDVEFQSFVDRAEIPDPPGEGGLRLLTTDTPELSNQRIRRSLECRGGIDRVTVLHQLGDDLLADFEHGLLAAAHLGQNVRSRKRFAVVVP